jgi:GTP 3',8-cyclase
MDFTSVISRHKIFAHPDRLIEWLASGKTKPITMELDSTNKCNNNCIDCAGNRFDPFAELSYNDMEIIVDKVAKFIKGIVMTGGGESDVNPATRKIISYIKSKNIDVGFVTNGLLLNKENLAENLAELVNSCMWIRVSVYSSNQELVWKNIRELISAKKNEGADCMIGTAYLTDKESTEDLEVLARKAKESGVDYAEFRPYHHSKNNLIANIISLKHLENENFKIIYSADKYNKIKYNYGRAFGDEFRFVVSATGEVFPDCFTRGIKNFSYGNLLTQSFEEIWNSEKREKILSEKLLQKNCPSQCYEDSQNNELWNMRLAKNKSVHVNFI